MAVLLIGGMYQSFAQNVSKSSKSKFVSITKDPPKPPYLEMVRNSLQFIDSDQNQAIDANEQCYIKLQLANNGQGAGLSLKGLVSEQNNIRGLSFDPVINLGALEVGQTMDVSIPLKAGLDLQEAKASFSVKITEANGFGLDPVFIEVETRAFRQPLVKVVDYQVSSEDGTTLEKRRPFTLQLLVQNVGQGTAKNVEVNLPIPDNVFCLSANQYIHIGNLEAGEEKLIEFEMTTNNLYSSKTIPFEVDLSENYRQYTEDRTITLTMNQSISNEKIKIKGAAMEEFDIKLASLGSEVDKNIPYNPSKNPNRIALIIGNEDYTQGGSLNAEINVDYARRDAQVFKEYAQNTLGVDARNVHYLLDASAGRMQKEIDLVVEILKRMNGSGELLFYYAGHGYPDEFTKVPYLVPVDVDATNLSSAIRLKEVYDKLAATRSKKITLFLDACFSGGGRNQGLLAARGPILKPKEDQAEGNMVVFAASSESQSALPYHQEKHGMFTYFLLKKMQESAGNLTYGELAEYLKNRVGLESLKENQKTQDPNVNISPAVISQWENWRFN